jgi:tetratricopeptide (TPR) repeat protein
MLTPGTRLGPYEILGSLGAGGMGQVYRARDARLDRQVALKVMNDAAAGEGAERFQREARAAAALNHPHICAVYDVGEAGGRPFLVMELIEGHTLRDMIGPAGIDPGTTVRIASQVADALDAAHSKGVIHRDIKPGNIMVTGGRHVKVLDFGLAKYSVFDEQDRTRTLQALTQTGLMLGTPHYMAPELFQGAHADVRTDLWALGVVLYQMLSGRVPFSGATPFEVGSAILREAPAALPDAVLADLRAIVDRLLAKGADHRFQRAADLRDSLEMLLTPTPARGSDPGFAAAVSRPLTITGAPASANPDANDAFSLAVTFLRVQNDMVRGQKHLERALALDPNFPEARRFHAFNRIILLLNGYTNDVTVLYEAEDELREAERQDPTLASLPAAFAAVYMAQGRKEMLPAVVLNDSEVAGFAARDIMLWRAIVAWHSGDLERAKSLTRRSLETDSLFGAPRMFLGEVLREFGDAQGAVREHERVLAQAPTNITCIRWLVLALLDLGKTDQARALLEEHRAAFHRNFMWRQTDALLLAVEGRVAEAREAMDAETLKFAGVVFMVMLETAEFYAVIGESALAVEWVQSAVRHGDERIDWMRRSPRLASIQEDPRLKQLLQSLDARRTRRAPRS